jgi:hypothetical protein
MIITSSQQIQERLNPSEEIYIQEFEMITLIFASYICILKNKKLNYLNFLKILIEDKKVRELYCKFLNEDSFQNVVRLYINSTPNVYKKIFRSKFNLK